MEEHQEFTLKGELGLMAAPSKSAIHIGEKFSSFNELHRRLKEHKEVTFTEYWIRDNRTLLQAARRVPDRVKCSNRDLKYYYIKFSCIHGGQKLKQKPKLSARHTHSFKQGCRANIYCTLSNDSQFLVVKSMINEHNHPLNSRKSYRLLQTRQRKLIIATKKGILNKKVKEKLAANEFAIEAGNLILENLSNRVTKTGVKYKIEDDFQLCVMILEGRGCQVEVLTYDNNEFKGLFFQDKTMMASYESFPEILFIDGTYKLADPQAAVYLFVVVDSIGNFVIIATAILYTEKRDCVDWLISTFKDKNPKWTDTCVVMTDTNRMEREVLREHFYSARLLICQFHAMQVFKRDITCKTLNITSEEEILAKECIQNIMHSKYMDSYDELYNHMKHILPAQVMKYYNDNWHPIRHEWVLGFSEETGDFLSSTSNRVASVNRRLRSKTIKFRFFKQFLDEFFVDLQKQRNENDQNIMMMSHKVTEVASNCDLEIQKYMDLLTSYAFKYFEKQYLLIDNVSKSDYTTAEGAFLINSSSSASSEKVTVTPKSCECSFFNSMGLPCRHLLFVRHHLKMDLFDASLCLERWTKRFYTGTRRVLQPLPIKGVTEDVTTASVREVRENNVLTRSLVAKMPATLSSAEKHSRMLFHTNKLAALASEVCEELFDERLLLVRKLIESWENLEKVDVIVNHAWKDSVAQSKSKLCHSSSCIDERRETTPLSTSPQSPTCPSRASAKKSSLVSMPATQEPPTLGSNHTKKRSNYSNRSHLHKKKKSSIGPKDISFKDVSLVNPAQTECALVSVFCTPLMLHTKDEFQVKAEEANNAKLVAPQTCTVR